MTQWDDSPEPCDADGAAVQPASGRIGFMQYIYVRQLTVSLANSRVKWSNGEWTSSSTTSSSSSENSVAGKALDFLFQTNCRHTNVTSRNGHTSILPKLSITESQLYRQKSVGRLLVSHLGKTNLPFVKPEALLPFGKSSLTILVQNQIKSLDIHAFYF
jgi:hypothetical protein